MGTHPEAIVATACMWNCRPLPHHVLGNSRQLRALIVVRCSLCIRLLHPVQTTVHPDWLASWTTLCKGGRAATDAAAQCPLSPVH